MDITFHYHPIFLLISALLAAGVAYWSYRHTVPPLEKGRRLLLGSLRFATFFVIFFLLFQPVMRRTMTSVEEPVIAVLVDDTQSISLGMDETVALERLLADLQLPESATLYGYRFSNEVTPLPAVRSRWPEVLALDGERTDIAGALDQVREELRDRHLAAVVLLSDGRYNSGTNPIYVAERYPVPIHTVVLGDTTARRDVVVGRIAANRIAYLGVEQPVEVEILATGYPGNRLSVELYAGRERLSSSIVDVQGESAQIPVELTYTPREAGLRTMTVRVSELDGELTHSNNRSTLAVQVIDQKRQVLLLGGAPGPDVASIRQILARDSDMEVTVRVQKNATSFYEGDLPSDLDGFDALVLAGYPGSAADARTAGRIRDAIQNGLPVLFLMTPSLDLRRLAEYFDNVLPATVAEVRPGWAEALARPTATGAQHPILSISGVDPSDWRRLPPLLVSDSRWSPAPDARVLATTEVRGVSLDDPLLVVQSRGGSRAVALLGANSWRWKNLPRDLQAWDHLWPQTVLNALQWVTAVQDQRPVRVRPTREVFAGGESVALSGEVYDESLNPLSDALVEVIVTGEDGTEYPFVLEDVGNGRYALRDAPLPEGTYEYEATARRGGHELGTDRGVFAVGELALEHRDTQADPLLMRQIASRSGGMTTMASGAGRLLEAFEDESTLEPRIASTEMESNLWRHPLFLITILALLTVEWVIRKRSGLV